MPEVLVSGAFNDLRARDVRFLQEAARLGNLTVFLWNDESVRNLVGRLPEFPQAERLYMLEAIRYVNRVVLADGPVEPEIERIRPDIYLVNADGDRPEKQEFCRKHNLQYVVL
jgi:glycerol-3-phosphate cytidylyltransferase-like family protein